MLMIKQAVAGLILVLGSATTLVAQANDQDPWKRLPSVPATCYADGDFTAKLGDLYVALGAEKQKQEEINTELDQKLQALGQGVIMQRMMEYMRKDPQKAMKMMQAQQAAATEIRGGIMSADEAMKEREAEFEQLSAAFKTEMDAMSKPYQLRRDQVVKTGTRSVMEGASWVFTSKAAETEYNDVVNKENADYEARCATYFGADGKVRKWLATYRETVIDPVAKSSEMNDEIKALQMVILESPGAGFRSTAPMTAVRDYINVLRKAYELPRHKVANVANRGPGESH
jgi:hypothetical protein